MNQLRLSLALIVMTFVTTAAFAQDRHTLALWLFDETNYPNVTLTDAGLLRADLRLQTGVGKPLPARVRNREAGLVSGKFGTALLLPLGEGAGVAWADEGLDAIGTRHMPDRDAEVPEQLNLGYFDWTMEFWFIGVKEQTTHAVVWEVRNSPPKNYPPVGSLAAGANTLLLDEGRKQFVLSGQAKGTGPDVNWGQLITIPTDTARLNDGTWHHIAFTFSRDERQLRHYVDGKLQTLPEKGGWLPLLGQLSSLRLGRDLAGGQELIGGLDEFRVSDVVRYDVDFTPPGSFSERYSKPRPTTKPNGPPLLFPADANPGPIDLGGRKHVFIDGALLDVGASKNVRFVANPPTKRDVTDFRSTESWEATPRMGASIPDICSIIDDGGGKLRMLYTNGGFWGGRRHAVCLAESTDGIHWTKPELNAVSWDGSTRNNIVMRDACQGTMFIDDNPMTIADQRYRYVAWCVNRGFYVFSSADCIHWRRNESAALPFDPDGSSETFWDDQAGLYRAYFRALLFEPGKGFYRKVVRAAAPELLAPWPFKPAAQPQWHVFTLPKPTNNEFAEVDTGGQAYRMKATKYAWAPDTYLAFPWRYVGKSNIRPGSPMMVSRDGERWSLYEPPYYFASGWELDGRTVLEALSEQGMVRRGDEIWQYTTVRFTEHAGALYGGVEHEGGVHDRLIRTVQRLDGFVSLETEPNKPGVAVTKPLTFQGRQLELNAAVSGSLKVSLLDADGNPIPGFTAADCRPVQGDSVHHVVAWKGGSDVSTLAGKPCRIRLEFDAAAAKIFALQFVR